MEDCWKQTNKPTDEMLDKPINDTTESHNVTQVWRAKWQWLNSCAPRKKKINYILGMGWIGI